MRTTVPKIFQTPSGVFFNARRRAALPEEYELVIRAEGEVRDADGNLISTEPLEAKTVVTEEQAQQILEALGQQPVTGNETE